MQRNPLKTVTYASRLLGAFFCLFAANCSEEKNTTEQWQQVSREELPATDPGDSITSTVDPAAAIETEPGIDRGATRFLAYNLKNYLSMRRYVDGEVTYSPKPEEEIKALIRVIRDAKPDILGVCEIGKPSDLDNLRSRLQSAGVDLPHSHRVHGSDRDRALAILSRYPIIATNVPGKLDYTIHRTAFQVSRGILDVTIRLPSRDVRFLGVHFKSKRPIKEADQSLMRRNESLLLRQHIEDILDSAPGTQLLAYGDFNDTKRSRAVATIRGRTNSKSYMKMVELEDSRGENWTHRWQHEDIYSRIDFVMANSNLGPAIDRKACKLLDPPDWELASDHRPMLILIK